MAKRTRTILTNISAAELKRMLAVKERLEKLEARRKTMATELAKVEKEIDRLLSGGAPATRKKATRKKAAKKKTAKKKVVARKAGRKAAKKKVVAKKTGRKAGAKKKVAARAAGGKTTRRKATKKTAKKTARKAPRSAAGKRKGGATLEDVVIGVIKAAGKEMSFPDIRDTITSKKLYKSKSKNFDNVLRRTISTAKGIKRVGRGIYAVK